jgi:hypothetical protein
MAIRVLGVCREKRFSPGEHAGGDAEIFALTRAALERRGYRTAVMVPECLSVRPPEARVVFSMCQSPEALSVLQQWESQGMLVINTPAAVLACYRLALVKALAQAALPFPRSVVVPLGEGVSATQDYPMLPDRVEGWWIKRGDVHAMQPDDVVFVPHAMACQAQLARLRQRGIGHAVVQEHVPGQEIKFYALRGHGVVHCFAPHGPATLRIDQEPLHALVRQAGEILGLEIYGGDCILTREDGLYLVDVNDWPSFRGCRPLAAEHIAGYVVAQGRQRGLL